MTKPKPQIVVAGDVAIDWVGVRVPAFSRRDDTHNWLLKPSIPACPRLGGAYLLKRYVGLACDDGYDVVGPAEPAGPIENVPPSRILHSMITVQRATKDGVYRVQDFNGFAGPLTDSPAPMTCTGNLKTAQVVVIDDVGNGFREDGSRWAWPLVIERMDGNPDAKPSVIYKMGAPLFTGALWRETLAHHRDRMIVIIEADELRELGAHVSRRLSWERTAADTAYHVEHDHRLKDARACAHLIVRFGVDGALHSTKVGGRWCHRLFFDPERPEGGFESDLEGTMVGLADAFTAALVGALCRPEFPKVADSHTLRLADGVREGIHASRRLLRKGFGRTPEDDPDTQPPGVGPRSGTAAATAVDSLDRRLPRLDIGLCGGSGAAGAGTGGGEFDLDPAAALFVSWHEYPPVIPKPVALTKGKPATTGLIQDVLLPSLAVDRENSLGGRGWTILDAWHVARPEHIPYDIVLRGLKSAPGLPRAQFGDFVTVDRAEIESFRAIANLIREYLHRPVVKRPLCIAVFGQPGSGKSFGVREVAKSLGGVKDVSFNVAQFESARALVDAFHALRDVSIDAKVPLVFFDEFDCNDLKWLSPFLESMQDGVFTDAGRQHPIGKAIFVFAGGTSDTHQDFVTKSTSFAAQKAPDFVSRLRGFVNIAGPNRETDARADDKTHRLRRAVVLRSMLERHKLDDVSCVDFGVLRAMIDVSRYKHGVRSMEAILDMSLLSETSRFDQAAMPSAAQLEMHVDAAEFYRLMHGPTPLWDRREELAKAIHEKFRQDNAANKDPDDESMRAWDDLLDEFRDSNRHQADFIPVQLDAIGCEITTGPPASFTGFSPGEIAQLAEREHERWEAERRLGGWCFGRVEKPRHIHHDLLPWLDLDDGTQEYDRNAVKAIPGLLAAHYLRVRRRAMR